MTRYRLAMLSLLGLTGTAVAGGVLYPTYPPIHGKADVIVPHPDPAIEASLVADLLNGTTHNPCFILEYLTITVELKPATMLMLTEACKADRRTSGR